MREKHQMSGSSIIGGDEISPEMASVLTEARALQVARIEKAFTDGWQLPAGICAKYRARNLALHAFSTHEQRDAYRTLFDLFCEEVERQGGFPAAWTEVDPMTIFGEICCGERTDEGGVVSKANGTVH